MAPTVTVKQNPEAPVATEVIAAAVEEIAAGMRRMRAGRLNDRALVLLLHHSTGVPQCVIRQVIAGLEGLEVQYLKKKTT